MLPAARSRINQDPVTFVSEFDQWHTLPTEAPRCTSEGCNMVPGAVTDPTVFPMPWTGLMTSHPAYRIFSPSQGCGTYPPGGRTHVPPVALPVLSQPPAAFPADMGYTVGLLRHTAKAAPKTPQPVGEIRPLVTGTPSRKLHSSHGVVSRPGRKGKIVMQPPYKCDPPLNSPHGSTGGVVPLSQQHADLHVLSHEEPKGPDGWAVTRVPTTWGRPDSRGQAPTVAWGFRSMGPSPKPKQWTAEGLANSNGPYTLPKTNGCFQPSGGNMEVYKEKAKIIRAKLDEQAATARKDMKDIEERIQEKEEQFRGLMRMKREKERQGEYVAGQTRVRLPGELP